MQRALQIGVVLLVLTGGHGAAQTPNGTAAQATPVKADTPRVNPDGTVAQPGAVAPVKPQGPSMMVQRPVVPPLKGLSVAEAQAALEQRGLVLGAVSGAAKSVPELKIATQLPVAGTSVALRSAVDVELEAPQKIEVPQKIAVPSVLMLHLDEAGGRLKSAGLREQLASGPKNGTVLAQEPQAGAMVAPGTTVRLAMALKGNTIVIPQPTPSPVWGWYVAGAGVLVFGAVAWWWSRPKSLPDDIKKLRPAVVAAMVARPNPQLNNVTMDHVPEVRWSVRLQDKPAEGVVSVRGEIEGEQR